MKLVDGKFVHICTHGFKAWSACATCCMNLADAVPTLMHEVETLKGALERLKRLAQTKGGRTPGVALGWIRSIVKEVLP